MKYASLLLIEKNIHDSEALKGLISKAGVSVIRYNNGPIAKNLLQHVFMGSTIIPMPGQDYIFDPLYSHPDEGYSDFDWSKFSSAKDRKEVERDGEANYLMAACFISKEQINKINNSLIGESEGFIWCQHKWAPLSDLDQLSQR